MDKRILNPMASRIQFVGFLALSLIWGSTWAAIRVTVQHMPPLRSVSLRFLVASAVLVPVLAMRRSRLPTRRELGLLSVLSIFSIVIPFSLTAWAEGRISSALTSILSATTPFFTALLEPYLGGHAERRSVPRPVMVSMLLGFAGVLLVLSGSIVKSSATAEGAAAIFTVVIIGSAIGIIAKHEIRGIPILTVATVQCPIAAAVLGVASLLTESDRATNWDPSSVFAMLFLGIFSTAIGFLLFYWLMAEFRPYQLASRQLIMPVVAVTEGVWLLHEPLPWTMLAGSVLVLLSLIWVLPSRPQLEASP